MSSKTTGKSSHKSRGQAQASPSRDNKAISADAFDQFIEEQLQKPEYERTQSDPDVVCHVY
jgi:hypothetical protein